MNKKDREILEEKVMQKDPSVVRTLLSKERTLLSKQRTAISLAQLGLGLIGFGLLVIRFFADASHEWFLWVGLLFVVVSFYIFIKAYQLYKHYQWQLSRLHEKKAILMLSM